MVTLSAAPVQVLKLLATTSRLIIYARSSSRSITRTRHAVFLISPAGLAAWPGVAARQRAGLSSSRQRARADHTPTSFVCRGLLHTHTRTSYCHAPAASCTHRVVHSLDIVGNVGHRPIVLRWVMQRDSLHEGRPRAERRAPPRRPRWSAGARRAARPVRLSSEECGSMVDPVLRQ